MNITKRIRDYLLDEQFKINIFKNKINICNYDSIGYLDYDLIIINYQEGQILIKGEKLVVSKLLNNEILISGTIKNIEMR